MCSLCTKRGARQNILYFSLSSLFLFHTHWHTLFLLSRQARIDCIGRANQQPPALTPNTADPPRHRIAKLTARAEAVWPCDSRTTTGASSVRAGRAEAGQTRAGPTQHSRNGVECRPPSPAAGVYFSPDRHPSHNPRAAVASAAVRFRSRARAAYRFPSQFPSHFLSHFRAIFRVIFEVISA